MTKNEIVPKRIKENEIFLITLKKMTISKLHKPFNAQEDTGVPFHRNFNSIFLRRDHKKKKSYKHRAYESVDEKSLSQVMSQKTTKKRIWSIKG